MFLKIATKFYNNTLKHPWTKTHPCISRSSIRNVSFSTFNFFSKYAVSQKKTHTSQDNKPLICAYLIDDQNIQANKSRSSILNAIVKVPLEFCSRHFASSSTQVTQRKTKNVASSEGLCPSKAKPVADKCDKKKTWGLFSSHEEKEAKRKKQEECFRECCEYKKVQIGPDPDLSCLGDRVYKTCGSSYVVQREKTHKEIIPEYVLREENLVEKLELHPDIKNYKDPIPDFKSVGQRLLDLADKKLHPLYKKYMTTPKENRKLDTLKCTYKSRYGPVKLEDIPCKFKFNKELLDRKNIYAEFKRVEPPRQLLAKILEIQLNEKPTLEKKVQSQNE